MPTGERRSERAGVRPRTHSRLAYYRRIFAAYLLGGNSHLTFWHERPEVNFEAPTDRLGQYYMLFTQKAAYPGPFDVQGIPLLDYRGLIGKQYNPIAIAQFGLAQYNTHARTRDPESRRRFLRVADWLVEHLEQTSRGLYVWNHHFDWEYREVLQAPWPSGLAQGQGISVLVRAALEEPKNGLYLQAAATAFGALLKKVEDGGMLSKLPGGHLWIEEYITQPPTHILNGFIWALWGVYDYYLATRDQRVSLLFDEGLRSLEVALPLFDTGYWSLYDLSMRGRLKMLASPFYHRLHIAQLQATERIASRPVFVEYATRWEGYQRDRRRRARALGEKAIFKLLRY